MDMEIFDQIKVSFRGEFAKNFLTLMTGTAFAQVIPLIASVVLAKLYTPDMFGSFTLFVSLTSVLSIIATLKFEEAILLPKCDDEGKAVFQLSIFLNLSFLLCTSIILFFTKNHFTIISSLLNDYIFFIPIGVFFINLYQSFVFFSNRNKNNYKMISISKVSQNFSTAIIQVLLYKFSLLGLLLGRVLGFFLSIFHFVKLFRNNELYKINKSKIKTVFLNYRNFAIYYTPNAILNQISNSLPLYMLPFFFNLSHAGFFAFSIRIVLVPLSIITNSLQQVFYKEIVDKNNDEVELHFYILKVYKKLAIFGVIPHLILFFSAPAFFVFFFGEEWRVSGHYTQYLIPWLFLVFLNSPVSSIYIVKGKQKEYFVYEIFLIIARASSLFLGFYLFNDPSKTIMLYGLVGFVFNAYLIWYYLRISKN